MDVRISKVHEQLQRRPFRPFRICLSDGTEHVITNPDWVFLLRDTVEIGVGDPADVLPDRAIHCDPLHITRIEPADRPRQEP